MNAVQNHRIVLAQRPRGAADLVVALGDVHELGARG
jgi:hypothetical protein